jgi:hypothetical protein
MRKEFIPNWANPDFLAFVEQLQWAIDDGISAAAEGNDELWMQIKTRSEEVWKTVLNAEEVFWPDVGG